MDDTAPRTVPVRVFQVEDRISVVAPLPGLEPEDIAVAIDGRRVTIRGDQRGPHQHDRDLLVSEWTIGPYERELTLPEPVDGVGANATYGNGVLVIVLPKAVRAEAATPATFRLEPIHRPPHGEHVGHSGSTMAPTTTDEHRRATDDAAAAAARPRPA